MGTMTEPRARVVPGWNYREASRSALALVQLLAEHGIAINAGSVFERHVLTVLYLVESKEANAVDAGKDDIRSLYRTLIGVHEFASLLLKVQNNSQFQVLLPHLRLLNGGEALQNSRSLTSDQATNKLFELYMGAVALQCGRDLELDDPVSSRGHNPDVLITIDGRRWGIACKVLHSKHPQTFADNLTEGIRQIDESEAEVGVVAFNVKNILSHDEIWPLAPIDGVEGNALAAGAWLDPEFPFVVLVRQLTHIGQELHSHLGEHGLVDLFHETKSLPGYLLWGASPSAVLIDRKPTPASVRALNFQQAGQISDSDSRALNCLNWAIYPDSSERGANPLT